MTPSLSFIMLTVQYSDQAQLLRFAVSRATSYLVFFFFCMEMWVGAESGGTKENRVKLRKISKITKENTRKGLASMDLQLARSLCIHNYYLILIDIFVFLFFLFLFFFFFAAAINKQNSLFQQKKFLPVTKKCKQFFYRRSHWRLLQQETSPFQGPAKSIKSIC